MKSDASTHVDGGVASVRRARVETPSAWQDYWELTKPEISFLVVVSALAGFLLGSPGLPSVWVLAATLLGTALTAGGVGMLNHYLERELDAAMKRTAQRPLPAGRVAPAHALYGGLALVTGGIALLCPLTNPLTAILAGLTVVLYLLVYTPMKQRSKYNTLVGTLPGALPALGGYTAAAGSLEPAGWAVFGILAAWQMPHFLSLAWMYRKDYGRAGYIMLPTVEPDGRSTARQTLAFTTLLLAVSVLPYVFGATGLLYLCGALVLGCWFLRSAWRFYGDLSPQNARAVLTGSIIYIPALVGLIALDHFLPLLTLL